MKTKLFTDQVKEFQGEASHELADRCPDRLVVFPSSPCSNIGCEHLIQHPGYMNCSFVAAEAGEHTLEAIGEMMGITREGVRRIEVRAIKKIRAMLGTDQHLDHAQKTTLHKQVMASGRDNLEPLSEVDQLENPDNVLSAVDDRKLGECSG